MSLTEHQKIELALVDLKIQVEQLRSQLAALAPAINDAQGTHYTSALTELRDEALQLSNDLHNLFHDNAIPYLPPKHISRWVKVAMQEQQAAAIKNDALKPRDWQID